MGISGEMPLVLTFTSLGVIWLQIPVATHTHITATAFHKALTDAAACL